MAFLFGWVRSFFGLFGFFNKEARVMFLGLDNAGKTTLLYRLKKEALVAFPPTYHPNQDELWFGNIKIRTFDMGGHATARLLWKQYIQNVDAVVFVVDAVARDRFPEAKRELDELLLELNGVPFLILGNKIDVPTAASDDELRGALGLHQTSAGGRNQRAIELFMCSILNKEGYKEGFEWLTRCLK
eukprot:gnl/Spiro4/16685_TR8972_c0_g1_i1.p2 gnl/Spiro4/16685_TR8972_c0_g1~~gnl/Spiro4/16685_TR8972_c0_g1_i1.p2  ORF type:complete len:197 (+),score=55.43 gnl/Spiro4/16685_TR8972_c0_g1_i1:34-591(+)